MKNKQIFSKLLIFSLFMLCSGYIVNAENLGDVSDNIEIDSNSNNAETNNSVNNEAIRERCI